MYANYSLPEGGESVNDQSVQQMEIPQEIRSFLESMLDEAKMTSLDAAMRDEMVMELFTRLDQYLTTTIIENLPAEKLEAFVKMNEEKKPKAEIEAYLKQHIPNINDVMTKAFMQFRDLYLGNVAASRNTPSEKGTPAQ